VIRGAGLDLVERRADAAECPIWPSWISAMDGTSARILAGAAGAGVRATISSRVVHSMSSKV